MSKLTALPESKINDLFRQIGSNKTLYIPVTNNSGKADFVQWTEGAVLSDELKTVRSAKDFFFPKSECLVKYQRKGLEVKVEDPRKELEDFVIFGVRACDAKSFEIIDNVYLNMQPVDSYYKNRRDHGTVVTLACSEVEQTCFCSTYGIDAANPAGDVSSWKADGYFYFKANTDKGTKFLDTVKSLLEEKDDLAVEEQKKSIKEKTQALPFAHLDLSKFTGKDMLKIFNSKVWDKMSKTCLGCGTCTYVCPTCMCFDVRDFDSGNGITQVRCWDSCMFSDFTQMAAANPRLTQKERFRQRFMHKLMYYPMAHNNLFACVGCGRCLNSCPANLNIVKVIKAFNEETEEGDK